MRAHWPPGVASGSLWGSSPTGAADPTPPGPATGDPEPRMLQVPPPEAAQRGLLVTPSGTGDSSTHPDTRPQTDGHTDTDTHTADGGGGGPGVPLAPVRSIAPTGGAGTEPLEGTPYLSPSPISPSGLFSLGTTSQRGAGCGRRCWRAPRGGWGRWWQGGSQGHVTRCHPPTQPGVLRGCRLPAHHPNAAVGCRELAEPRSGRSHSCRELAGHN